MKTAVTGHFDAAHHLPHHEGKCKNVHGHRWHVLATFAGAVNQETGMVKDFKDLKGSLSQALDWLDHKDLNTVFPNPTAETICEWLKARLDNLYEFGPVTLLSVRVSETPDTWVEC